MRKLNEVIKTKQHELKHFESIDMGLQALRGKRFQESKIEAIKAFLVVARQAETQADKTAFYGGQRH